MSLVASRSELALVLMRTREQSQALLEPLTDEQSRASTRNDGEREATAADDLYDAFAHARAERGELPIRSPAEARGCVREVRERLPDLDPCLVAMVAQHELQNTETMAQTLALAGLLEARALPEVTVTGDVLVPAGSFLMGSTDPWGVRQ